MTVQVLEHGGLRRLLRDDDDPSVNCSIAKAFGLAAISCDVHFRRLKSVSEIAMGRVFLLTAMSVSDMALCNGSSSLPF